MKNAIMALFVTTLMFGCTLNSPAPKQEPVNPEKPISKVDDQPAKKESKLTKIIKNFAEKINAPQDKISEKEFSLITLSNETLNIKGLQASNPEFPRKKYNEIEETFNDWEMFMPADGVGESIVFYLKDNFVCKKHAKINATIEEIENDEIDENTTYQVNIICGENPRTIDEVFSEMIISKDCLDAKINLIRQGNEVKYYLQDMENYLSGNNENEDFGERFQSLSNFAITLENADEEYDYFVLTEIHTEENGETRETNTKRFRVNHENPIPAEYDIVGDVYNEMTYTDEDLKNFEKECQIESVN